MRNRLEGRVDGRLLRLLLFSLVVCSVFCLSLVAVLAASDINITGEVDAGGFTEGGSDTLSNDISGEAATCDVATTTSDITCTGCFDQNEVLETGLTGSAPSLTVGDISCTDCINATDVQDSFLFNTGDTGDGDYTFNTDGFIIDTSNGGRIGVGTASPLAKLHVGPSAALFVDQVAPLKIKGDEDTAFSDYDLFRFYLSDRELRIDENSAESRDFSDFYCNLRLRDTGEVWLGGCDVGDSGGPTMVIQPDGSNVGIGTSDPEELLHLVNDSTGASDLSIIFDRSTDWIIGPDADDDDGFEISTGTSLGATSPFLFTTAGNLSIGTESPEALFHVNGSFEVSQRDDIRIVGSLYSTSMGDINEIVVVGHYAYVGATTDDRVGVVDVTNRTGPSYLDYYSSSTYLNGVGDLDVEGTLLYASGLTGNYFTIIDVSDPTDIAYLSSISGIARQLVPNGGLVYTRASTLLSAVDVSDPAYPFVAGNLSSVAFTGNEGGIDLQGDFVYIAADTNDSLTVVNISNPRNMTVLGSTGTTVKIPTPYDLKVVGPYAYIVNSGTAYALSIFNVTDPSNPEYVGSLNDTNLSGNYALDVAGNLVFIASNNYNNVAVIDVSDPTSPKRVAQIVDSTYLSGARGIDVVGRYAYVAARNGDRLTVLDLQGYTGHAASIGDLEAGELNVDDDAQADKLYIGSGLSVGPGGLFSQGDLMVGGTARITVPTMYLTSATFNGSHNCDDEPATCCATGYHMCNPPELLAGGRRVEYAGTGRATTTYDILGDVHPGAGTTTTVCTGWTSDTSSENRYQCKISTSVSCQLTTSACASANNVWCCSD